MAILTLRNVSKAFGNPDNGSDRVVAVSDVSLDVNVGESYSIIGPSGCGKSTLLRIIGGLIPASGGELNVGNERVGLPLSNTERSLCLLPFTANKAQMVFTDEITPGRLTNNLTYT